MSKDINELENEVETLRKENRELKSKIENIEKTLKLIKKEMLIEDDEEKYTLEITCPYCEAVFEEEFGEELKDEVSCPECGETIELDWEEDCECEGCSCEDCNGECGEDDEETKEQDDDM